MQEGKYARMQEVKYASMQECKNVTLVSGVESLLSCGVQVCGPGEPCVAGAFRV